MKRYFLIDTENVGKKGFEELEGKLNQTDYLVVAHNTTHGNLSHTIATAIEKSGASIRMISFHDSGKNAMDFTLVAQLGLLIASEGKCAKYYLISKDKGYQAAVTFLKAQGYDISIYPSILDAVTVCRTTKEEFIELLPDFNRKVTNRIYKAFCASTDPHTYHNRLQQFLQRDFWQVYERTKHLFETCK